MIDESLVALLRCPETGLQLRVAPADLVRDLEKRRADGALSTASGAAIETPIENGLIREDDVLFFPIREGIPVLLTDEAIVISS